MAENVFQRGFLSRRSKRRGTGSIVASRAYRAVAEHARAPSNLKRRASPRALICFLTGERDAASAGLAHNGSMRRLLENESFIRRRSSLLNNENSLLRNLISSLVVVWRGGGLHEHERNDNDDERRRRAAPKMCVARPMSSSAKAAHRRLRPRRCVIVAWQRLRAVGKGIGGGILRAAWRGDKRIGGMRRSVT